MITGTFINLPVADLERSLRFFTETGCSLDNRYRDERGACVVLDDKVALMVLVEPFFQSFSKRDIVNTRESSEVIIALMLDSREAVDALAEKAIRAGARQPETSLEGGFMYVRRFADPDGHLWELGHMDEAAAARAPATAGKKD